MDKIDISNFIDKTIFKTRERNLRWKTINPDYLIKPLPGEHNLLSFDGVTNELSRNDSYFASFKTGVLLLLVFEPAFSSFPIEPPDGCILSLRMQDEKSKYAVEISNTESDTFNATELIRLYNLIDKDSSSVSALIDDFLNS